MAVRRTKPATGKIDSADAHHRCRRPGGRATTSTSSSNDGWVDPARAIRTALTSGKSVVSANKALLAESTRANGQAAEAQVDLYTSRPPWPVRSR